MITRNMIFYANQLGLTLIYGSIRRFEHREKQNGGYRIGIYICINRRTCRHFKRLGHILVETNF
jgi:hypothetical protein